MKVISFMLRVLKKAISFDNSLSNLKLRKKERGSAPDKGAWRIKQIFQHNIDKVAIYLMKERTEATNREIGEAFLGLSNSAIGKVYQRFKKEINGHRKLRHKVTTIEKTLSFVGG